LVARLAGLSGVAALLWLGVQVFTAANQGTGLILGGVVFVAAAWGIWKMDRREARDGSSPDRASCLLILVAIALLALIGGIAYVVVRSSR